MSGHTPGPWRVSGRYGTTVKTETQFVCTTIDGANDVANARLISAAPEMLEALEALTDALTLLNPRCMDEPMKRARSAIAKAKGETT